ncbi:hypothetical protein GQ600_14513 [Phytophthora cactorum]|nr:hypothetical protein GQ600_14513 [Phytophthora cactorum]
MVMSFGIGTAFYLIGFSELVMVVVGLHNVKGFALPWNEDFSVVTVATASVILTVLMYGVPAASRCRAL